MYNTPPAKTPTRPVKFISPLTPGTKRTASVAFEAAPEKFAPRSKHQDPVCQHKFEDPAVFKFPEENIGCHWRQQPGAGHYCCELETANNQDSEFLELVWLLRTYQNHDNYSNDNFTLKAYLNSIDEFMATIHPEEPPDSLIVTQNYGDYAIDHASAVALLMQFDVHGPDYNFISVSIEHELTEHRKYLITKLIEYILTPYSHVIYAESCEAVSDVTFEIVMGDLTFVIDTYSEASYIAFINIVIGSAMSCMHCIYVNRDVETDWTILQNAIPASIVNLVHDVWVNTPAEGHRKVEIQGIRFSHFNHFITYITEREQFTVQTFDANGFIGHDEARDQYLQLYKTNNHCFVIETSPERSHDRETMDTDMLMDD